jgi:site-specific recombinase XerD
LSTTERTRKKNSIRPYEFVLSRFDSQFHDRELGSITSDEILSFLNQITEGTKQSTRRSRYSCLASFFNFIKNAVDPKLQNLCSAPMLRKLFRPAKIAHWTILGKEVVDEIIFRTTNPRNRLMLELMARGGMRISEVLKLISKDVDSRKLILRDPKSGNETEVVFISQKVADRLKEYIKQILYEKQTESGETPNHQFRMFELIMEGWSPLTKLSSTI